MSDEYGKSMEAQGYGVTSKNASSEIIRIENWANEFSPIFFCQNKC